MILKCGCGWEGINLTPDHKSNTARCPRCNAIFEDIPADAAVGAAQFAESQIAPADPEFLEVIKDFLVFVTPRD